MAFSLSEKGIRYNKLFKSVLLPFNDIRSIIIMKILKANNLKNK